MPSQTEGKYRVNPDQADILGWREWVSLLDFQQTSVKAKVDTGARTSALHAWCVEPFSREGQPWVRFGLHPRQGDTDYSIDCCAPLLDQRQVTDSGGHREMRYVISTRLALGGREFTAEITLTDRENMRFRMLLGREAIKNLYLVDSGQSFLKGGDKLSPPKEQ